MSKDVVVIGGGPAGLEAARAAATAGAHVTVISDVPPGGRAGWHSLLPSKVWLAAADSLGLLAHAHELGIAGAEDARPDPAAILARIRRVADEWNGRQVDGLQEIGVQFQRGTVVFESAGTVVVKSDEDEAGSRLQADAFIVAPGSVPVFPEGMRPDGRRILAPRFASHLETLPPSVIVVGAGATGSEFAYLFNRLGVTVTWITDELGVLPMFDEAAGHFLAEKLVARGIELYAGHGVVAIEQEGDEVVVITSDGNRYTAAAAFVAIGRLPDVDRLNLEAAGLSLNRGTVAVDAYGRTAVPSIYLAGDVTGMPMVANRAIVQGWVAGRHAAGKTPPAFRPQTVVGAIYTEPQVAQVGSLEPGDHVHTTRLPFTAGLKAHLLPEPEGFVKLAYDGRNGRLVGAVAVGPHAADVLAPAAVAMQAGMSVTELAALHGAHPTVSELAFLAARLAAESREK